MQEAVYHGVPLLGIPLFGDQDGNLAQANQRGFSLTLNFEQIDEEIISDKLNQILENESYKTQAKFVSAVFRDRPKTPMETGVESQSHPMYLYHNLICFFSSVAIFWTEYVLRRNTTSQLHSVGRDLNVVQYHSLDVAGMLAGIFTLVVYTLFTILKIFGRICSMRFTKKATKPSKKTN
jgi:hypothetical protein